MNARRNRNHRTFGLESLEIRNAPSHFGIVAHAAATIHPVHVAAQVKHITDLEVNHKKELTETGSSADSSRDSKDSPSTDPSSTDSSRKDSPSSDPSSTDPSSTDPKSDR
jgi:hypothetical protein